MKKCPNCKIEMIKRPLGRKIHNPGNFTVASMYDIWCPKCNYSEGYKEIKVKY